ncbi:12970_t:CDS:2 [Funneliformis mosseae]|uniref:12970_t:CDS:1 n=1 Tax=Funneliformis mosseae TaxID=27381 RepID=A0A9N9BYI9_FUNMO|nr:12970_t:CDS:2 [Funneliformis mosseae]
MTLNPYNSTPRTSSTPEGSNITVEGEFDRQAGYSFNRHNRNESEITVESSAFSSDSETEENHKRLKRKKKVVSETNNPPPNRKPFKMWLIKLFSYLPWSKKTKKSKDPSSSLPTHMVVQKEKEKRSCCSIFLWIMIIMLLSSIMANLIALDIMYARIPLQNETTVVQEDNTSAVVCSTLLGSPGELLKLFPCDQCLNSGMQFYNALNWMKDSNYCGWGGVKCDDSKNIIELKLTFPFVARAITSVIGELNTLKKLTITGDGKVPNGALLANYFKLENLEEMSLISTGFTGPIPNNLGKMTSLRSLKIVNNTQLGGPIPSEISLKSLKELDLSNNQLSGAIPESLGTLDLNNLSLSGNSLTGDVPNNICQKSYASCNLSNNQLIATNCGECSFA